MKKNFAFTPLLLLIVTLILSACMGSTASPQDSSGETARLDDRAADPQIILEPQVNEAVQVTRVVESEVLSQEYLAADGDAALAPVQGTMVAEGEAPAAIAAAPESVVESSTSLYQVVTPPEEVDEEMIFDNVGVNPFVATSDDRLSTFAVDVDTGAYTVMRRYLTQSLLPPAHSVRVEEYVNYFKHNYALPSADDAFAIHLEGAPSPYSEGDDYRLIRIGLQGYDVAPEARPDAMLIFVIDVSGSMNRGDRLGLVKQSLRTLVTNLRSTDQVGIVVYGSNARVLLEPTFAVADRTILDAIDRLQPEGSTNAEAGLAAAYRLAEQFAEPGNINRLILCSDGVANVGFTTAETILTHANEGIALSTFGFGMDSYNDALMEQLADQGNGAYAYIDNEDEANRVFASHLTSTLLTIAQDVKVQVEFNPDVVATYRLLGYENRDVADEDFTNDAVDAGEIGAGHSVTALYEVRLVPDAPTAAAALTVNVRYAEPGTVEINQLSRAMALRDFAPSFESASPGFQLAVTVAEFAEILRNSFWAQDSDLVALARDTRRIADMLGNDADVQEFAGLVSLAAELIQ